MTIIARDIKGIIEALHRRGIFLVADLPGPMRLKLSKRGMLIARCI